MFTAGLAGVFLKRNPKRGAALIAKCPPHPRPPKGRQARRREEPRRGPGWASVPKDMPAAFRREFILKMETTHPPYPTCLPRLRERDPWKPCGRHFGTAPVYPRFSQELGVQRYPRSALITTFQVISSSSLSLEAAGRRLWEPLAGARNLGQGLPCGGESDGLCRSFLCPSGPKSLKMLFQGLVWIGPVSPTLTSHSIRVYQVPG